MSKYKNSVYGIYEVDVKSIDKYKVSPPETYPTRDMAEKQIKRMIKSGQWKRNELKILQLNSFIRF